MIHLTLAGVLICSCLDLPLYERLQIFDIVQLQNIFCTENIGCNAMDHAMDSKAL